MTKIYHVFSDELPNPRHTEMRYTIAHLRERVQEAKLNNYFILLENARNFNLIEVVGRPESLVKLHIEQLTDKVKALKFDLEKLESGKLKPEKVIGRGFNSKYTVRSAKQYLGDSILANESKLLSVGQAASILGISTDQSLKCRVLSIDAWSEPDGGWVWNQWFDTGLSIIDPLRLNNRELLRELRRVGVDVPKGTCAVEDDQNNLVIVKVNGRRPLYAVEYGPVYN